MSVKTWTTLCLHWSHLVFGDKIGGLTPKVRILRLLEEVMELAQSEKVLSSEVEIIMKQVYGKPTNPDPESELGGVLTTLCAYAGTRGYDLEYNFYKEFMRIMDPKIMERVRIRNLSGDKIGINDGEIRHM